MPLCLVDGNVHIFFSAPDTDRGTQARFFRLRPTLSYNIVFTKHTIFLTIPLIQ